MRQIFTDRDREAQRRMIEAKVQRCQADLERARTAAVDGRTLEVERVLRNLRGQLNDAVIPRDFHQHATLEAKRIERDAHMKVVDTTLEQAREAALARRDNDRAKFIKLAREHLTKAVGFGAPTTFRDMALKKMDVISLTGGTGTRQDGPGKAKPADFTPQARDLAKGDKRIYKRFAAPRLAVSFDNATFRTVDWSIGGMLIGGWSREVPPGSELPVSFGLGDHRSYAATVRVVRFDPRKGTLAVRFVKSTMEALEFVRNLIKAQMAARI